MNTKVSQRTEPIDNDDGTPATNEDMFTERAFPKKMSKYHLWTEFELMKLYVLVHRYGRVWSQISAWMGIHPNSVRCKYNDMTRLKKFEQSRIGDLIKHVEDIEHQSIEAYQMISPKRRPIRREYIRASAQVPVQAIDGTPVKNRSFARRQVASERAQQSLPAQDTTQKERDKGVAGRNFGYQSNGMAPSIHQQSTKSETGSQNSYSRSSMQGMSGLFSKDESLRFVDSRQGIKFGCPVSGTEHQLGSFTGIEGINVPSEQMFVPYGYGNMSISITPSSSAPNSTALGQQFFNTVNAEGSPFSIHAGISEGIRQYDSLPKSMARPDRGSYGQNDSQGNNGLSFPFNTSGLTQPSGSCYHEQSIPQGNVTSRCISRSQSLHSEIAAPGYAGESSHMYPNHQQAQGDSHQNINQGLFAAGSQQNIKAEQHGNIQAIPMIQNIPVGYGLYNETGFNIDDGIMRGAVNQNMLSRTTSMENSLCAFTPRTSVECPSSARENILSSAGIPLHLGGLKDLDPFEENPDFSQEMFNSE